MSMQMAGEQQVALGQLISDIDTARQIVDSLSSAVSPGERAALQQQLGGLRKQAHAITTSPLITEPILEGYCCDISRQMTNVGGMIVNLSFEPVKEDMRLQEVAIASEHMAQLIYRYLNMKSMAEYQIEGA